MITLEEKIHGCLLGAAIGAELGYSRLACPQRFAVSRPEEISHVDLRPVGEDFVEERGRINFRAVTPFINLGVQAYLRKQGRVTPEDFGELLQQDEAIAAPVFFWDGVHSVQELLKEGMSPRLSGLGIAPCGNICAAMPAVGIYHCNDPEYAYLDGVELASVAQPRLGADWAALCAAAIAAAFAPHATGESPDCLEIVLKLCHQNNKELFLPAQPCRPSLWTPRRTSLSGKLVSERRSARWKARLVLDRCQSTAVHPSIAQPLCR